MCRALKKCDLNELYLKEQGLVIGNKRINEYDAYYEYNLVIISYIVFIFNGLRLFV